MIYPYLEFFGPPGAGKSTIHERLVARHQSYNGNQELYERRLQKLPRQYRVAYRAMPRRIQNFVKSELLKDRFEQQAFRAFSRTNPTVLKTLASGISDLEHQPGEMMILLRGTIARYQLGVETTPNDELLCLDGYFTQRAESILWREPGREFSLEAYLNAIPTPSLLIYVKAPVGTCLDRQRDRRRVVGSRPWVEDVETAQTHLHELCANIADAQRTRTTVVEVENNGSVDEAVKRVESAIQRAQSADMRATNSF